MHDSIKLVKELAPSARLDTCPFDDGDNGTGFFVRIGHSGHWLSKVRKHPRAAWADAARRMRAPTHAFGETRTA